MTMVLRVTALRMVAASARLLLHISPVTDSEDGLSISIKDLIGRDRRMLTVWV